MEKCLTSIDNRMQRHTPRILESMNDMDLLSHNDMGGDTAFVAGCTSDPVEIEVNYFWRDDDPTHT